MQFDDEIIYDFEKTLCERFKNSKFYLLRLEFLELLFLYEFVN